jgi:hypothetical protein
MFVRGGSIMVLANKTTRKEKGDPKEINEKNLKQAIIEMTN